MRKNKDYENDRFRSWHIILYSDSTSYDFNSVMQIIKSYKDYAYISHSPDDEINKTHYHINLFLDNPTYRHTLSNKLGVPENYIDSIDNVRVMNRYLTHIDFPERTQYDLSFVVVSAHFHKKFKKCYDDLETEYTIINKIYFKIDELATQYNYSTLLRELLCWCSDECYENVYKKYRLEFIDYIKSLL